MLNEISKIFQNGIQDLIKDKGPREKDPYIFLLFNCPEHFFKKYCDKDFNIIDFKGLNLITNLFVSCDPMLQLDEEISKRTLDELSKMEDNKIEEEISIRNNYSNIIEGLLNHVFEHFENAPEDLLSDLLAKIREERMIKMRNEFPSEYEKINKIFEKILEMENKEMENYSYLEYDDFVLIFARILKYFTGLDIQLTFTDLPNSFALSIYGNEKQIDKLAEKKEYELQLKNYGYKYQKILEEANKKSPGLYSNEILTGNEIGDDNRQLLSNSNDNNLNTYGNEWIPLKYSDLREKNVLCFAPTEKYKSEKEEKFQRYFGGDEYHECNVTYDGDEICECGCSKYRGIDKLRLIYDSIDTLVKMNYLRQENILNYILIKRNYIDYGDKLSIKNIVFKSWNIFNTGTQMDYIFTIRNFYNEEIAYYFLWITSLVKWLIIPAILGIIVNYSNKIMINPDGSHNHTILLLLSAFLALWGTAFLNYWDQKEKIFNYIWGTESFQRSEPDSEAFVPDGFVTLVFNRQFPYVSATKTICKQLVSYIVLFLMLTAIVIGVYIIFMLKVILIKKYPEQQTYIGILSALENTVLIAIMSSLYSMIAYKLNDWQNYRKDFQRMNALAVKFILYDLINNFYPLFYIAFIKKATIFGKEAEQCYGFGGNDSCLEEIEIQLYTTLSVNFGLNFLEIGLPIFHQGARMIALKKKLEIKGIKIGQSNEDNISALSPHSIDHQMILDEYTEMISEYSEILVDLGYLLLFGVVAPLVPFLVLLLVYTEKFFDSYKIFFLSRVKLLDQSNGLNIYNTVFRLIVYGGMFSNVAFLIFGDNYFMPTKNISYKVVLYCAVEFVIFILTLFVKWNIMPSWFEYLDDIKEVYNKKYFRRSAKNLPHLLLLERQKKHKLRSSQIKIKTE
jgi:hypothetical protein